VKVVLVQNLVYLFLVELDFAPKHKASKGLRTKSYFVSRVCTEQTIIKLPNYGEESEGWNNCLEVTQEGNDCSKLNLTPECKEKLSFPNAKVSVYPLLNSTVNYLYLKGEIKEDECQDWKELISTEIMEGCTEQDLSFFVEKELIEDDIAKKYVYDSYKVYDSSNVQDWNKVIKDAIEEIPC